MTDAGDLNCACCLQVCAVEVDGYKASDALFIDEDTRQLIEVWGEPSNFMHEDTFARQIESLDFVEASNDTKLTPIHLNDNERLSFLQIADLFDGKTLTVT